VHGVRTSQTTVSIVNGAARNCQGMCLALYASEGVPQPEISGNTFGPAGNEAVIIDAPVRLHQLGGNSFTGSNGFGAIVFNGANVTASGTFPATGDAKLGIQGCGLTVDTLESGTRSRKCSC
jgi:hypothetical protein